MGHTPKGKGKGRGSNKGNTKGASKSKGLAKGSAKGTKGARSPDGKWQTWKAKMMVSRKSYASDIEKSSRCLFRLLEGASDFEMELLFTK